MKTRTNNGLVIGGLITVALVMIIAGTGYGADRLKVKDSSGATKFVVKDTGRVGIGTTAPAAGLDVRPINNPASGVTPYGIIAINNVNTGQTNNSPQNVVRTDYNGTTNQTITYGLSSGVNKNSTGPMNTAVGIQSSVNNFNASGAIEVAVAFYAAAPTKTGAVNTSIGFYSADPLSWNYFAGNVGIGIAPAHLIHLAGGANSDGTTWNVGSSREYKENISELSTADASEALEGLNPVLFNYKTDKYQRHVGFIAEDVPELVALKDRKSLSPMDIVAVLTKAVKDQKQTIESLTSQMAVMREELNKLKATQK